MQHSRTAVGSSGAARPETAPVTALALDLRLDSNPAFTGGVLVAYARAVYRLHRLGQTGCITPPDVPPAALSPKTGEALRAMI